MERARARPSVVVYGRGEVKRGRASVESIRRWVEGLSTLQCRNFPEKEDFARAEAPGVHNRQTMEMRWTRTTRGSTDRLQLNRWPTFFLTDFSDRPSFEEIHREVDDLKLLASP